MKAMATSGSVTGAATTTMLAVIAAADRRPRLKQIIIALSGVPTDVMERFALRRITTASAGTSSASTVLPCDSNDGLTVTCTARNTYTVEPTYAPGNLADIVLHRRATVSWEPPAGVDISCPIGTANGLGLQQLSSGTTAVNVTFIWDE